MSNYCITPTVSNFTFIACLPSTDTYYHGSSTLAIPYESNYGGTVSPAKVIWRSIPGVPIENQHAEGGGRL